jgi:hypothetical protein
MTAESFAVDLGALTGFATELSTQLGGMAAPIGQLVALVERQLRLGAFGEAHALGKRHHEAVAELHTLMSQARDAIEFAQEVTGMVGKAYQNYDDNAAGMLNAAAGAVANTVGPVVDTVDAVAGGLLSIVDPKA